MQNVVVGRQEYASRKDTEVPLGARVSWQGTWAGTITAFSLATIIWALALAIIALTMQPTAGSLRGASIALWICLMAAIVVGNFFGGLVASRVRGSPSKGVGLLHGFITWGLTFVVGVLFGAFFMRGVLVSVANALPDIMTATPAAAAAGGPTATQATAAGRTVIDYLIGFGWSWFGTWFVALLASLAGAAIGMRRTGGPEIEREEERREEIPPITPLTPAPTA